MCVFLIFILIIFNFCVLQGESNHIQLKLITEENNVILFKIKRTTYLRKLMRAYSDRAVSININIFFLLLLELY